MINKPQEEIDINDEEPGKLFVGGLSWETTEEKLHLYFGKFGEIIDTVVMKNTESGQSRGFGFVTFADPNSVTNVLNKAPHLLDGRAIDPKPCSTKAALKSKKSSQYPKVFLGGLPFNITETELRSQFSKYGEVMDVIIMYDHEKNKCRGFGFLSFEKDEDVNKCVADHYIYVNGKKVEAKRAEPRDGRSGGSSNQWSGSTNGGSIDSSRNSAMANYPSWGAPPAAAGYGYGAPNPSVPYGSWGGPPPQWGPGYAGYPPYGGPSYGGWNWNMPPQAAAGPAGIPPTVGGPAAGPVAGAGVPPVATGPQGAIPSAMTGIPNMSAATASDTPMKQQYPNYGYTGYGSLQSDSYSGSTAGGRSYGSETSASVPTANSYGNAPGPQRNSQGQQGYHPYRRS